MATREKTTLAWPATKGARLLTEAGFDPAPLCKPFTLYAASAKAKLHRDTCTVLATITARPFPVDLVALDPSRLCQRCAQEFVGGDRGRLHAVALFLIEHATWLRTQQDRVARDDRSLRPTAPRHAAAVADSLEKLVERGDGTVPAVWLTQAAALVPQLRALVDQARALLGQDPHRVSRMAARDVMSPAKETKRVAMNPPRLPYPTTLAVDGRPAPLLLTAWSEFHSACDIRTGAEAAQCALDAAAVESSEPTSLSQIPAVPTPACTDLRAAAIEAWRTAAVADLADVVAEWATTVDTMAASEELEAFAVQGPLPLTDGSRAATLLLDAHLYAAGSWTLVLAPAAVAQWWARFPPPVVKGTTRTLTVRGLGVAPSRAVEAAEAAAAMLVARPNTDPVTCWLTAAAAVA